MHKHLTGWGFLVCVLLFTGACSDDAPVSEPETKAAIDPQRQALPVREWYPTPKHAKPRIPVAPVQPPARIPMTQQPSFTTAPATQQQGSMRPQPYVFQPAVQPPTQWNGAVQHWQAPVQQPAMPQQYPYQYNQRPWGNIPDSRGRKQPGAAQNSDQQGSAADYWQYNVYPAPGMPGYVW